MADFVMLQRLSSKTHVGPEAVPVPPTNSHDRKTVKKDRQCIDKETTKGTADVDDEEAARSRLEIGQRVKVDGLFPGTPSFGPLMLQACRSLPNIFF